MLLILQNNCDEFWSWSWAYPIITAFILGILLGWLFNLIFGGSDKNCKCCEGVKAELEACRSNINILTSRETKSADFIKNEGKRKLIKDEVKVPKLNIIKTPKKKTETKKVKSKATTSSANKKVVAKTKTVVKKTNKSEDAKTKAVKKKVTKKTAIKKTPKKVAKLTVVKSNKKDDLTKVEGIGPKIQEHFNNGGIYTWEQLENSKVERLQEILDLAGPRYRIHNPASWSLQAAMCVKGEWDALQKWQDEHKRGRL